MISKITVQIATTKAAVTPESVQLFPRILMIAQTAIIGALTTICSPMATII